MAITNKFPYSQMKRETTTEGRKYLTPDGHKLPSVTTILDATKSEESKQALQNWRKRLGQQKAQEITTMAASRGTRMHKWLENYVVQDEMGVPGTHPVSQHSHKMAKLVIENGLSKCQEFWGTEVSLYYPEIYAGTTDLLGVHDNYDAIMDHKQTNRAKKREWIEDYFVQLTAYADCHNKVYNTKIRKGVIFMCSQHLEYQEFILEGNEFDHYSDLWWKRVEQYYKRFL